MSERASWSATCNGVLQSVHDAGMEQERIQVHMESANLLACIGLRGNSVVHDAVVVPEEEVMLRSEER